MPPRQFLLHDLSLLNHQHIEQFLLHMIDLEDRHRISLLNEYQTLHLNLPDSKVSSSSVAIWRALVDTSHLSSSNVRSN